MEIYRVILVVDRTFGEQLQELPKDTPIWIVDTEINKPAVHARWKEKHESYLVGLTSFRDKPEFTPDALAASIIDTIDMHHGEEAHTPPFSQLTIIGASPTTLLQETLEDFGFRLVISNDNSLEYEKEDSNIRNHMERFFPLKHLTVEQLRELYRDACKVGKLLVEYDQPGMEGHYEISMPEDEILKNISADSQNHLVFHEDFEGYPDMTTIAFPLSEHPFTTTYIDIDNARLGWFVKKYELTEWWQMEGDERKHYPFTRFYTLEPMKRHYLN